MENTYTIRPATERDFLATEQLAKEAFADRSHFPAHDSVCNEHYVLHLMRESEDYIPALDYVAVDDNGRFVGQITWSHAGVRAADGTLYPAVTFGPVSVLPALQSTGIGSALVRHTIALAREQGHTRVVLMGHPDYYPRFGFERAEGYGIAAGDGNFYDACMVLPLQPGAFDGVQGRLVESKAFAPDEAEFVEFEKAFGK